MLTAVAFAFNGAAWADDWADCGPSVNLDSTIRACSNVITTGQESRDNLAIAYYDRGIAYGHKGDLDREITATRSSDGDIISFLWDTPEAAESQSEYASQN
jgi:hypothetical protein